MAGWRQPANKLNPDPGSIVLAKIAYLSGLIEWSDVVSQPDNVLTEHGPTFYWLFVVRSIISAGSHTAQEASTWPGLGKLQVSILDLVSAISLSLLSAAETHQNKSRHHHWAVVSSSEQQCSVFHQCLEVGWSRLAERVGSLQQFSLGLLPHNPTALIIKPSHWSSRSQRCTLIGHQPQNTLWLCLIYGKSLNPAWKRFPQNFQPSAPYNGKNNIAGQDGKGLPLFLPHCIKIKKRYKWKSYRDRWELIFILKAAVITLTHSAQEPDWGLGPCLMLMFWNLTSSGSQWGQPNQIINFRRLFIQRIITFSTIQACVIVSYVIKTNLSDFFFTIDKHQFVKTAH